MNKAGCHSEVKIEAGGNESYGQSCPCHPYLCQILDSKVTRVQCQPPLQCLQGLSNWEDPGIHTVANSLKENPEAI